MALSFSRITLDYTIYTIQLYYTIYVQYTTHIRLCSTRMIISVAHAFTYTFDAVTLSTESSCSITTLIDSLALLSKM